MYPNYCFGDLETILALGIRGDYGFIYLHIANSIQLVLRFATIYVNFLSVGVRDGKHVRVKGKPVV